LLLPVAPPIADPSDTPQVVELKRQLYWAQLKIEVLEERLRLRRIQKYGPPSEKLSDAQLELLEGEPEVSHVEVQAESEREPLPARAATAKPERKHPGRRSGQTLDLFARFGRFKTSAPLMATKRRPSN
jgi:hypothetical protein